MRAVAEVAEESLLTVKSKPRYDKIEKKNRLYTDIWLGGKYWEQVIFIFPPGLHIRNNVITYIVENKNNYTKVLS